MEGRRDGLFAEELELFCGRSAFGEDFAAAEDVEHGVAAEGAVLPGQDHGDDVGGGETTGAEVGIQLDQHLVGRDVVGPGERRNNNATDAGVRCLPWGDLPCL